jgi:hypothetical protein
VIKLSALFASTLLALYGSAEPGAQTLTVDRIDVLDHGIYTSSRSSQVAAPGTAAGTTSEVADIRHTATTRTIPAQEGVEFGFRYTVVGAPAGAEVPLHFVTIFPPPGMHNPAKREPQAQSEYDHSTQIGVAAYKSYSLRNDWEVVPGNWTMQIWHGDRKLAEQTFTLVKQ